MGRVVHFEVQCDDIERSQAFYEQVFGWKVAEWGGDGGYRLAETGPSNRPGIDGALSRRERSGDGADHPARGFVVSIEVDDLAAALHLARELGGRTMGAPSRIPGVGTVAWLEDPSGNPLIALEPMRAVDVRIEEVSARPAIAVEFEADQARIADRVSSAFHEVGESLQARHATATGMPFSMYEDMTPHPDGAWHVVAGFPVAEPMSTSGRVHPVQLPAGTVAVATHLGPYESLGDTYAAMQRAVAERGFVPAGPMWEYYCTDPVEQPDPSTWRTDVYMRIEPVTAGSP